MSGLTGYIGAEVSVLRGICAAMNVEWLTLSFRHFVKERDGPFSPRTAS